jgi:hypothetical protein
MASHSQQPQQQPTPAPSVSSHTTLSSPPLSHLLPYPQTSISQSAPNSTPPQTYPPHPCPPNSSTLHPSILPLLDPSFVSLYNNTIAKWPPFPHDLTVVRSNYSSLYRFATRNPSGVGGIGETSVPGWPKYPGEVNVRVYVPPGEEIGLRRVWPVHFNFHGGGKSDSILFVHSNRNPANDCFV